jgi:rhamnosyltransferase
MSTPIRTVSAVVVCFHPDPATLKQLITSVLPDVMHIWMVNNGQPQTLSGEWGSQVRVIECGGNEGVAAALNAGFEQAFASGADAVIGFDQDSEPPPGLVSQLRARWNLSLQRNPQVRLAAIGPATCDKDTARLLHTFAPYNWIRRRVVPQPGTCMEVDHLITSGCLISRTAWQEIGPVNTGFFIDWIDVEWCGRARHAGYQLLMDGDTVLPHRIGQASRSWLGRYFHEHSPFRHYFVLRNALIIWRDPRFALGWRTHHVLYALRVILANLIYAPGRAQRVRYLLRGAKDGWANQTGPQGQAPI